MTDLHKKLGKCPTCGSNDPTIHKAYQCGHSDCPCTGYSWHECEDKWHGGEQPAQGTATIPCPDGLGQAVLEKLYPRLRDVPNYLSVWLSHDYSPEFWNPKFAEWQRKLDDLRTWAKGQPYCQRNAILGWLDYYQDQLDSARSELSTQATRKEMDAFEKSNEADRQKAKNAEKAYPISEMPQ